MGNVERETEGSILDITQEEKHLFYAFARRYTCTASKHHSSVALLRVTKLISKGSLAHSFFSL